MKQQASAYLPRGVMPVGYSLADHRAVVHPSERVVGALVQCRETGEFYILNRDGLHHVTTVDVAVYSP